MKKSRWVLSILLCVLAAGIVRADDKSAAAMEEMMKVCMAAATPGADHQHLAEMVGTWDTVVKSWMDPSAPPSESKGTSEMSMILGGRYMMQRFQGEMMGQPFEGLGYTGYDNVQKKYVGVWMDNMSTGMMRSTGEKDPKSGNMVMASKFWDPMSGAEKSSREVLSKAGEDHFVFEMFTAGPDGQDMKAMEIHYTKKK